MTTLASSWTRIGLKAAFAFSIAGAAHATTTSGTFTFAHGQGQFEYENDFASTSFGGVVGNKGSISLTYDGIDYNFDNNFIVWVSYHTNYYNTAGNSVYTSTDSFEVSAFSASSMDDIVLDLAELPNPYMNFLSGPDLNQNFNLSPGTALYPGLAANDGWLSYLLNTNAQGSVIQGSTIINGETPILSIEGHVPEPTSWLVLGTTLLTLLGIKRFQPAKLKNSPLSGLV